MSLLTYMPERPGENPSLFTASLAGGPWADLPELGDDGLAENVNGAIWRVVGADIVAQRGFFVPEAGRLYEVRAVVRRYVDPVDPEQDAVRLAIQWYASTKAVLSSGTTYSVIEDVGDLVAAVGRREIIGTVSRGSGTTAQAPSLAVFGRVYVQTYGVGPTTDIETIAIRDVTEVA